MGMKGCYLALNFGKHECAEEENLFEYELGSLLGVEEGIFLHGKKNWPLLCVEVISLIGKEEIVLHGNIIGKDKGVLLGPILDKEK